MVSGVLVTLIISVAIVAIVVIGVTQDYLVKREQIRANAMVRAEEVKAKNQLEIERLVVGERTRTAVLDIKNSEDPNRDSIGREKLKY
jgi:hypothetical protein